MSGRDIGADSGEPDTQSEFLRQLAAQQTRIAGDVVELGTNTWAIHGSIPVDGEVILAEYATYQQAIEVLAAIVTPPEGSRSMLP